MREAAVGLNERQEISAANRACFCAGLSGNGRQDITCDTRQVKSRKLFHKRDLRGVTDRNVLGISYVLTHELARN